MSSRFLKLTDHLTGEQWLNPDDIVLIRRGNEGGTGNVLRRERDEELYVLESPEAVPARVDAAGEAGVAARYARPARGGAA